MPVGHLELCRILASNDCKNLVSIDPRVSASPGVQAGQAGVSDCLSPRQG